MAIDIVSLCLKGTSRGYSVYAACSFVCLYELVSSAVFVVCQVVAPSTPPPLKKTECDRWLLNDTPMSSTRQFTPIHPISH